MHSITFFIQEELGYKVSPDSIKALGPAIASAGTSGAQHFMFYAEVNCRSGKMESLIRLGALVDTKIYWTLKVCKGWRDPMNI